MDANTKANTSVAVVDESDEPPPSTAAGMRVSRMAAAAQSRPVAPAKWDNWRWQLANRVRDFGQLQAILPDLQVSADMAEAGWSFPMAITPYYASLIQRADPSDPIFAQAVPRALELQDPSCLMDDPLNEDHDMPVPGLIHRYADRALVLATSMCSMYCRHCTRKRVAGQRETQLSKIDLVRVIDYLGSHPEIKDVIISGGDPLTLSTPTLERIVAGIRSVPSVEIIRIGTRTPVVLPMRITADLVRMLKKYHPIFVNTHFNHPRELTESAAEACRRLADAGIPMGNQTVLLRGVNDDPLVLADLFRGLVRNRVRPYYLFQCDLVRGVEHFRTPMTRGIEIMEYLRGRLSGLAIPTFIVDTPHGGGKVPVLPNYIVSMSPTHTVLRTYEGALVSYPEPRPDPVGDPPRSSHPSMAGGVWDLATGRASQMVPSTAHVAQRGCGCD